MTRAAVHDDAHAVWSFGESADVRSSAMRSLQAPDFALPDLEGRPQDIQPRRVDEWRRHRPPPPFALAGSSPAIAPVMRPTISSREVSWAERSPTPTIPSEPFGPVSEPLSRWGS